MREAIRRRLVAAIPEISDGERCFEPNVPDINTPKPYLVIQQGTDSEDTPWTGFRRIMEVWPNVSQTSFLSVDSLADKIVTALHNQLLVTDAGAVFTCVYMGTTGQDHVDTEWDILTRGLRFAILAIQPVMVNETVANDPWLDALGSWTGALLGSDWSIYQNFWPLGYKRPAVLWRISGYEAEAKNSVLFEVRKRIIGHVLGLTPNQQLTGVLQIVEALGSQIKIPLDLATRRYITISKPSGDQQADGLKGGQITITATRLTCKPLEEAPLIGAVNINGEVK